MLICSICPPFVASDPPEPADLYAEAQVDLITILLSWTPSSGANGYIISYDNGAGSGDTMAVSAGYIGKHLLTGLQNGTTYNISIMATSIHFNSDNVWFDPVELVERKYIHVHSEPQSC